MNEPPLCDSCGSALNPKDVDPESMTGFCEYCTRIVDFGQGPRSVNFDPESRAMTAMYRTAPESEIAQELPPGGVTVYAEPGGLTLVRRWYHPSAWVTAAVALFWITVVVMMYAIVYSGTRLINSQLEELGLDDGSAGLGTTGEPVAFGLFLVPFLAIGLYLVWSALAVFFNTSRIELHNRALTIRHGPFAWPKATRIAASELEQLYSVDRSPPRWSANRRRRPHGWFELHARHRSGRTQRLLKGLPDVATARYIERRVESYLELVDGPVAGELPRF